MLYPNQILSESYEDNVEKIITAGTVKINQHYIFTNQTIDQALIFNNGMFFRDVLNARKYGVRYEDFTPVFLRDSKYAEAYVWFKLAVMNQERYSATLSCLADSFFRIGQCVKLASRRGLTTTRTVPIQALSAKTRTKRGNKDIVGIEQATL